MNTKQKGDIAVSQAIAYYVSCGYEILIPLGDRKPYDLVIDTGERLEKVQVKYTSTDVAGLRTHGGNKSGNSIKRYDSESFDRLFVYQATTKRRFDIPWAQTKARSSISVKNRTHV